MTIPEAFDLALQRHQSGRLADAEALYRQVLAAQPDHSGALHHLGLIAHKTGRHDLAVDLIRQAIAFEPNNPIAHSNLGEAFRAAGRLDEAIAACRRALELKPAYPNACYNLGVALRERGQVGEAVAAFRRALEFRPAFPEALNNLGVALAGQRQQDEAIAAYRQALQLKPDYAEALNNLGVALRDRRQFDEAVAACRSALECKPHYPEALNNLGNALKDQGKLDEAIAAYRRALELRPGYVEAHYNLGIALSVRGPLAEAVAAYRRALELKPDYPDALNNLGNALRDQGQLDDAIAAYHRALELQPDAPSSLLNLGNALRKRGRLDESVAACRRALELQPDYPEALNNLGNALKDQGELDEAIAAYRHALRVKPEHARAHSNLIYTLHFHPGQDSGTILAEQQRWNWQVGDPLKQFLRSHTNDRSPERRLRVGYVSADFRDHPVGRYILPLFERHDRHRFDILCYSGVAYPDWMSQRLRARAGSARDGSCGGAGEGWRNTVGISDARLAETIREDKVDILVDLTMHTAGNRLTMFARQPAPVQVAWLGYPGATGLHSIGYRLTDARMDPPGEASASCAEEPVRLPDCWCCYDPVDESPVVNALPALTAGGVTFGSLNNFAKVNDRVLALWTRVLEAVKGSRLVMLCPEGRTRERVRAFFEVRGIAAERVELVGVLSRWEYLRLYHGIDIGLDPFPYNGMTTTCDALWMGAPVLTLPGKMPASRAGLSILSCVGVGELAADCEDDYARMAMELAGNLPRLAGLRAALRARMLASPLMDAPRFARNVEAAYRSMWERWCHDPSTAREG